MPRSTHPYIKIKGIWHYLYRAVDKEGNTIDFMLFKNRNATAAKKFFKKSIKNNGVPKKVTIDKSGANKAGLKQINAKLPNYQQIEIRQIKYLNNIVEQDHRAIKRIVGPMLGFKEFHSAKATLAGIELYHMLRKGQNNNNQNLPIFEQFYALAA